MVVGLIYQSNALFAVVPLAALLLLRPDRAALVSWLILLIHAVEQIFEALPATLLTVSAWIGLLACCLTGALIASDKISLGVLIATKKAIRVLILILIEQ